MKQSIWKYQLDLTEDQVKSLPEFPRLLTVQMQGDVITVWALVAPEAQRRNIRFRIVGTGNEADVLGFEYLGTVQTGAFVWHVWYRGE